MERVAGGGDWQRFRRKMGGLLDAAAVAALPITFPNTNDNFHKYPPQP